MTLVGRQATPDDDPNHFSDNAFFGFISASVILKTGRDTYVRLVAVVRFAKSGEREVTFELAVGGACRLVSSSVQRAL